MIVDANSSQRSPPKPVLEVPPGPLPDYYMNFVRHDEKMGVAEYWSYILGQQLRHVPWLQYRYRDR